MRKIKIDRIFSIFGYESVGMWQQDFFSGSLKAVAAIKLTLEKDIADEELAFVAAAVETHSLRALPEEMVNVMDILNENYITYKGKRILL